jgi:hypothetical protein
MIAAHGRTTVATVVTNDTKAFGRIKGLKVEEWTRQQGTKLRQEDRIHHQCEWTDQRTRRDA